MNTVRHWWVTVATLCVAALLAGEGHAWQVHVNGTFPGGYNWGKAVALDGAGNIIAGGETSNLTFVPPDFTVAKLSPLDGAEIWRFVIAGGGGALDVAVDGAGNVLAGGGLGSDGAVVKVDGATGTELWRYTMQGAFNGGYVNRIAPTQDGDVVAVETLFDTSQNAHFLVVRLASATGAEIWRRQITGLKPDSEGWSIAVDPAGDVIAAGRTEGQYQSLATIAKLDGATGTETWRYTVVTDLLPWSVTVDGNGDVIAGGGIGGGPCKRNGVWSYWTDNFGVVKLAGADGTQLWRTTLTPMRCYYGGQANAVRVNAAGDVFAAGQIGTLFAVVKLSGTDGSTIWKRRPQPGQAYELAIDAKGDVVATGYGPRSVVVRKFAGGLGVPRNKDRGRPLWSRTIRGNGSIGWDVVADPTGDIVAVAQRPPDFIAVKMCGKNGRWSRTYTCPH